MVKLQSRKILVIKPFVEQHSIFDEIEGEEKEFECSSSLEKSEYYQNRHLCLENLKYNIEKERVKLFLRSAEMKKTVHIAPDFLKKITFPEFETIIDFHSPDTPQPYLHRYADGEEGEATLWLLEEEILKISHYSQPKQNVIHSLEQCLGRSLGVKAKIIPVILEKGAKFPIESLLEMGDKTLINTILERREYSGLPFQRLTKDTDELAVLIRILLGF